MKNEAVKEADKILGSKVKFRRVMMLIVPVLLVIAYGFYSGEISKIIIAIFGK